MQLRSSPQFTGNSEKQKKPAQFRFSVTVSTASALVSRNRSTGQRTELRLRSRRSLRSVSESSGPLVRSSTVDNCGGSKCIFLFDVRHEHVHCHGPKRSIPPNTFGIPKN